MVFRNNRVTALLMLQVISRAEELFAEEMLAKGARQVAPDCWEMNNVTFEELKQISESTMKQAQDELNVFAC